MSLYQNAKDSLRIGILDLQHGDQARVISSLRNIYAGILLLIKEKTVPIQNALGQVEWKGIGKKTIGYEEI